MQEYDIQNPSQQTVNETTYEYNNSGQVIRANGGGYFDRYYGYDHVGRRGGNNTKWTGTTDYPASNQGASYDVWGNLTNRTSSTWGYVTNSWSTYQNNRLTQAQGWNSSSGAMPTENWQYDANGNATATGEQTHKFDAANRKVESFEQSPPQFQYQRVSLLLQQNYNGDGEVVKRFERETYQHAPPNEDTKYNLISTVLGGAVIATVNSSGVRGDETIYRPDGSKIATKSATVDYRFEAPFTGSTYEPGNLYGNQAREFDPFGGEIPLPPPPNSSPDWISVGNYQQSGNPLDAQGGCLEDGFPVDCSEMVKRVCVGNPRCMNKDNKVGGLGYYLAGVSARGDFKGRFGFKVLDGKLVPTVFVAGWADQRVWDHIGMAGLANYQGPPVYSWSFVGYNVNARRSGDESTLSRAEVSTRINDIKKVFEDKPDCKKVADLILSKLKGATGLDVGNIDTALQYFEKNGVIMEPSDSDDRYRNAGGTTLAPAYGEQGWGVFVNPTTNWMINGTNLATSENAVTTLHEIIHALGRRRGKDGEVTSFFSDDAVYGVLFDAGIVVSKEDYLKKFSAQQIQKYDMSNYLTSRLWGQALDFICGMTPNNEPLRSTYKDKLK